jgi:hypothetical protein
MFQAINWFSGAKEEESSSEYTDSDREESDSRNYDEKGYKDFFFHFKSFFTRVILLSLEVTSSVLMIHAYYLH